MEKSVTFSDSVGIPYSYSKRDIYRNFEDEELEDAEE